MRGALGNRRPYRDFYKGSQEKNTSPVAGIFLAFQPALLSRIVLAFRFVSSGRYKHSCSALGFLCQRFSSPLRDEASRSETNKQRGCRVATMVLLGTRGP